MKKQLSIILVILCLAVVGYRIYLSKNLEMNMTAYLERAANANSIELAATELRTAMTYLESNNINSGYTSILWNDPSEDIGFWYTNLKVSLEELEQLNTSSSLEKSNVLLKLRESLLNNKGNVIVPKGLGLYPNNTIWAVLTTTSLIFGLVGVILYSALKSKDPE
ncbi:hypothetical protein [Sphingobacterium bovistauri]|uniref:Four helix bundle sensory module for signal transduction n=1 Tax=Sphingobacterium bovistauri TaxID=2781959 RepID=A0ABS7Z8G2_9SPHI|nr:hypothetical protein [Sphingobacterium bovistauri]MCA5006478.1 hypothetical protein [Sphingobacterium bovistauri]